MVGLICCIVALAVIIAAALWVQGIDYMQKNHPDYKGEELFGEDENDTHSNIR
jgi:hypothetical protein